MALPYGYNQQPRFEPPPSPQPYSVDAFKRRMERQPNQFANEGLQELGGQDALNGTPTMPQSGQENQMMRPYEQDQQKQQQNPQTSEPGKPGKQEPAPQLMPPLTQTNLIGQVAKAFQPKHDGNGGNGGGGQGNGSPGKGDGGGGGGNPQNDGKHEVPWYIKGFQNKDAEGQKQQKNYAEIRDFLKTDPQFQAQILDYLKTKEDYLTNVGHEKDIIKRDYNKNIKYTKDQRIADMRELQDTVGAQGLIRSSGYNELQGNLQADYANQRWGLKNTRNTGLQGILSDKSMFLRQMAIEQQQARNDAIQRRTADLLGYGGVFG